MTAAQSQFLKDKELFERWSAIAPTDHFQQVLAYARAALVENGGMNQDMIHGANLMAMMLVSICDSESPPSPPVNSGLTLDLSVKRKTAKKA